MLTKDNPTLDNGRHLFAKSYEPSRSSKSRSFAQNFKLNNLLNPFEDKSRSGSASPDNREPERRRRVSYAGYSKIYNYGYIGEPRERMFDILVGSEKAMSRKVFENLQYFYVAYHYYQKLPIYILFIIIISI